MCSLSKYLCRTLMAMVLCLLVGCESELEKSEAYFDQIAETTSLDAMLNATAKTIVDLDRLDLEVVYPDTTWGTVDLKADDVLFFAKPISITIFNDSLYIADMASESIIVSSLDGQLTRQLGRPGEGPGEFQNITEITTNGTYLFVREAGNRIQVFNHQFNYVEAISAPSHSGIAVNDKFLYAPAADKSDSALVSVYAIEPSFNKVRHLLPLLSKVPYAYNNYVVTTDKKGFIYLAYKALPYIFVFDDQFIHRHTIELSGQAIIDVGLTPTRLESSSNTTLVQSFFQLLKVLEGDYLAVGNMNRLYLLDLHSPRFEMVKRIKFDEVGESKGDQGLHFSDMILHEGKLYLVTSFRPRLYQFRFDTDRDSLLP